MSAKAYLDFMRRARRELHQIPELDFELPQTLAYIRAALEELDCEIVEPATSCLCAYFDLDAHLGAAPGTHATIAIRADMDALPITEASGVAFCSTHLGKMHACGHDGHMAMALGAAQWVHDQLTLIASPTNEQTRAKAERASLNFNVLFVFQPAEETTGGAKTVCESGVFERYNVTRIFGFHVWPDLPKGTVATRLGPLLARSSETTLTIHGTSSHIAKSAEGNDALLAGAHFLVDAENQMTEFARKEPCLLKFGHATSGNVRNAISDTTVLEGSLRVFSEAMFEHARKAIDACAAKACAAYGCTYDLHFSEGYPPVINDKDATRWALSVLAAQGVEVANIAEPLLIAEDFAFYQQHLPGTFFLLGTGTGIPLHSDTFTFDEEILVQGLAVYQTLLSAE